MFCHINMRYNGLHDCNFLLTTGDDSSVSSYTGETVAYDDYLSEVEELENEAGWYY